MVMRGGVCDEDVGRRGAPAEWWIRGDNADPDDVKFIGISCNAEWGVVDRNDTVAGPHLERSAVQGRRQRGRLERWATVRVGQLYRGRPPSPETP